MLAGEADARELVAYAFDSDNGGGFGGGTIGYNWQFPGSQFVFGIEIDAAGVARHRGIESAEEVPERQPGALGEQVPDGVDDGRCREMDDPLLGPDPAQLAVADEIAPEPAEIGLHRFDR